MATVAERSPSVQTDRFDLSALPQITGIGIPDPALRTDLAGPWLLGHSFGLHGIAPRQPAGYDQAQAEAFQEGWQAGDCDRRLTRGWPAELRQDDEIGAYLADLHGADHDAQPDPFDVESWTIPDWEWREVSIGFVRDPEELIADAERERILGHLAYVGTGEEVAA